MRLVERALNLTQLQLGPHRLDDVPVNTKDEIRRFIHSQQVRLYCNSVTFEKQNIYSFKYFTTCSFLVKMDKFIILTKNDMISATNSSFASAFSVARDLWHSANSTRF